MDTPFCWLDCHSARLGAFGGSNRFTEAKDTITCRFSGSRSSSLPFGAYHTKHCAALAKAQACCSPTEFLSQHAIRLHFDFETPIAGKAIRISDKPMREWHAFATIDKPGQKGFSIVVSNAGDWTRKTIEGRPQRLWTRGALASGVLTIAPLFKKVVLVATGSGIGPCLPVLLEGRIPARVLWSTPHPRETFGEEIINEVLRADPKAIIWNTRTQGKPDLTTLATN